MEVVESAHWAEMGWGGVKVRWDRDEGSMPSGMLLSLAGNHLLKATFAWEL